MNIQVSINDGNLQIGMAMAAVPDMDPRDLPRRLAMGLVQSREASHGGLEERCLGAMQVETGSGPRYVCVGDGG